MDTRQNERTRKRSVWDNKRKCPMCARTFSKVEHLERHIRSHTKEKPFECPLCGRNDSLLRHVKDQHPNASTNKTQTSQTISGLSSTGQGPMVDGLNEQQIEDTPWSHSTTAVMSVPGDLDVIPMGIYRSETNHVDVLQSAPGETSHWNQSNDINNTVFLDGQQNIQDFDNWLTYGCLDHGLLRDWPFVIDDSQLGCATDDPDYSHGAPLTDLQNSWYTHLEKEETTVSGFTTPLPANTQEVDDNYRQSLRRRLQIRALDQNIPSAEFLNLCVRAYFKHFHPVFPVIHAATFRPSKTNAVLLLSICSIGSLVTGHPSSVQRGIQLFERLNKAILSNWETLMRQGPEANFSMIQAALLGQTFGLLSGQAKHLVIVDTFHGTIVAWARRAKIFQTNHPPSSDHQDLESRWREWVHTEETIRIALAVRIHDAEIASTLHHETFLPLASRRAPIADSDALFFASSPQEWIRLYRGRPEEPVTPSWENSPGLITPRSLQDRLLSIPTSSHFSIYSALEDVLSAAIDTRNNENLTDEYIQNLRTDLVAFYEGYLNKPPAKQLEALHGGTGILWHFIFISLYADLDLLEKSVGRDGATLSPSDLARVHEWARSDDSRRTVAHAIMIKRKLEQFPLTSEPALHVPRVIFFSAICLFCYSKYGDGAGEPPLDFPEFQRLDVDVSMLMREASGHRNGGEVEIGAVCGFVDLLQRIGHWEIARKFALILGILINAESN